ncbi:EAL domain-containing protein [Crocosphaera sp. UHCC 0190]|uniref:GGDEF and EAL domain-containing protein n=1 Tax=Crocosphaera sp. UHCC 0190 TaxID=3110246 RepID=UPI002B2116B8|nr:EAL domain-containing protein [Crocosphaera sp. UHCC 0190]MEA5509034.1 EAL domain-containing protein [Crocosphaera sp. UHCC 0190]
MNQKSLNINLTDHQSEKLRQYCQKTGQTESDAIREFINLLDDSSLIEVSKNMREFPESTKKENFLQLVLDNIPQLIFWKNNESIFLGCNRLWAKVSGLENPDEVKGKTDYEIYNSQNSQHLAPPVRNLDYYLEQDRKIIETGIPELHFIEHKQNPDGQEVWYDTNKIPIKDSQGNIVGILGTIENITERKLTERALFEEKKLAQITLQSIGEAVITTNEKGMIRELNLMAQELTGWTEPEAIRKPLIEVLCLRDETGEPLEDLLTEIFQKNRSQEVRNSAILVAKDKRQYAIENIITPLLSPECELLGTVVIFRDITQSAKLANQLSWEASHDALTGLINRREFEQQLRIALEEIKTQKNNYILCYLDLDQFKIINDTCGHIAGDELLRQITHLLQQRVRAADILARLGGDEFALLLKGCSLEQAETIAQTLRQLVKDFRFTWEKQIFSLGVSIGMVVINEDIHSVARVLNEADIACYTAKQKGRNCIYVYQKNDHQLGKKRGENQWFSRLNEALKENHFCLYSQSIVPLRSQKKTYHEILLRLLDESGNIILPMAFIPVAERYNLMWRIDQWVIENFLRVYGNYCQEKSSQRLELPASLYMINLSVDSLKNHQFIEFVQEQLSRFNVNPQHLCFEITETVAITHFNQTFKLIESLKPLGCSFALDDFGSGISSLSYLKNLPVDYLKINVNNLNNSDINSVDYTLIDCFNRIGHVMGIETIAEFVENQETLAKSREIGIDYGQGFEFDQPTPFIILPR